MLIEITNTPRQYAWGSTTLIAEMQGRPATGSPEAEIWFGDHPASPACAIDGQPLPDLATERLPFLVKLLAAAAPLSIQVHPSKAQAVEGYEREEAAGVPLSAASRNYGDDNHKPEVLAAVNDGFTALAGLRDLDATRRLVTQLGPAAESLGSRLNGHNPPDILRDVIQWLLSGEAPIPALIAAVHDAEATEFASEVKAVRVIAERYPGDPGVIVALLMNLVSLDRGQVLYAPAGTLHAYLEGLGVEVMAVSDNVLRGGLTPKHVDVPELLRILDPTPGPPRILEPVSTSERVTTFTPDVPDFRLRRVASIESMPTSLSTPHPTVAIVTAGTVTVAGGDGAVTLTAGRALYASGEQQLSLTGDGLVYVADPNSDQPR
ncbi:mannose-6-phosphate isomerase, class I [Microbacterium sp. PRC9]|uniref:mannose-6-phosphate isomerase, class I n=1 Tax=Microbacterium sp. PRC9 TaxID=2962591 RepID=UPI002881A341|nr:mannose-6-phosphate isomerase, class I [Microbacterium sp. PRC9]MDT0144512.1 mannose-6-phosphate isomerase, class I [Microbacterium sp. PRC9]